MLCYLHQELKLYVNIYITFYNLNYKMQITLYKKNIKYKIIKLPIIFS